MNVMTDRAPLRVALAFGLMAAVWPAASPATPATPGADPAPAGGAAETAAAATAETYLLAQAERPVSFQADQADRGEDRYLKDCEECHGDDLKGGLNGGAPLRGLAFEGKYFEGAQASVLFSFMSTQMPPNDPGRYSPTTYADLMAYILKRNGVQPGAPLPADLDALDLLIMEK